MRCIPYIICIVFLILAAGCTTPTSLSTESIPSEVPQETGKAGNNLPITIPPGETDAPANESSQSPILKGSTSSFDSIYLTVHTISVKTLRQKSGREFSVVLFNISVKNQGLDEPFTFENKSLVVFQSDNEHFYPEYPQWDYHQVNITNPLLEQSVAPGEEIRGDVYFFLPEQVRSMALYVRYPDWTIVGGAYIPDLSDVTPIIQDREYPKYLELEVPSAVQKGSLPDYHTSPGHKVAIINVSIANNNPTDVTISSENLLLLTEMPISLENARGRKDYLDFPLIIHPGETKSGSVLFGIYSGTKTNKLALTDNNCVIHSLIDLNDIYRYE